MLPDVPDALIRVGLMSIFAMRVTSPSWPVPNIVKVGVAVTVGVDVMVGDGDGVQVGVGVEAGLGVEVGIGVQVGDGIWVENGVWVNVEFGVLVGTISPKCWRQRP